MLRRGGKASPKEMKNAAIIAIGTFAYGLALGWWRSPEMAVYIALKLPFVFVATAAVVSGFSWLAALVAGVDMRYREVFAHMFDAMAVASKILLAMVPVVLFFVASGAPESGTRNEMRFAHSCLMLMHLMVMSGAGVVGNIRLYAELKSRNPLGGNLRFLLICWLTAFAVVGSQIGWMMRPLVGSPNIKVEFLREDALDSNVLESLFKQIIPNFVNKGAIR